MNFPTSLPAAAARYIICCLKLKKHLPHRKRVLVSGLYLLLVWLTLWARPEAVETAAYRTWCSACWFPYSRYCSFRTSCCPPEQTKQQGAPTLYHIGSNSLHVHLLLHKNGTDRDTLSTAIASRLRLSFSHLRLPEVMPMLPQAPLYTPG